MALTRPPMPEPLCETLESRALLSGDVNVAASGGQWNIRGDKNANGVLVTPLANGKIRIEGTSSDGFATKINGKPFIEVANDRPFSFSLGGGNDSLRLDGSASRKLTYLKGLAISMGDGLDSFQGQHISTPSAMTLDMGDGNRKSGYESASIFWADVGALRFSTKRGEGANSFSIAASTIRGNVAITGSTATFSVNFTGNTVKGDVNFEMGRGPAGTTYNSKIVSMNSSTITGSIKVSGSGGRSSYSFSKVNADTIKLYGGSDIDQFGLSSSRFRVGWFDGSSGNLDRIWGSGNTFASSLTLRSIERNELR